MTISKIATILPVADLSASVAAWQALLGPPSFVDGEAWAQFDVAGARIALAGTDRVSDLPGLMIKVDDLAAMARTAAAAGWTVGEETRGGHETRLTATTPEGIAVVFYAPLPAP